MDPCEGEPAFTSCGDAGEVCDGAGQCIACVEGDTCFSDGSDNAFLADANVDLPGGVYNFTTFTIEDGVTVTVTGPDPLIIKTQGAARIDGVLAANGGDGTDGITLNTNGVGGVSVAGGHDGGDGRFDPTTGPLPATAGMGPGAGGAGTDWGPGGGGSYGSLGGDATLGSGTAGPIYGDAMLSVLDGGSGAGGGSGGNNCGGGGGGAGGGIIKLTVFGQLSIGLNGEISAIGGDGGTDGGGACGGGGAGSGGTIWLQAPDVANDGQIAADGGAGGTGWQSNVGGVGGEGRIRIDKVNQTGPGTTAPPAGFDGGLWYEPAPAP